MLWAPGPKVINTRPTLQMAQTETVRAACAGRLLLRATRVALGCTSMLLDLAPGPEIHCPLVRGTQGRAGPVFCRRPSPEFHAGRRVRRIAFDLCPFVGVETFDRDTDPMTESLRLKARTATAQPGEWQRGFSGTATETPLNPRSLVRTSNQDQSKRVQKIAALGISIRILADCLRRPTAESAE
jgi:hypothetical protein